MRHPKDQLKGSTTRGEGPTTKVSAKDPSAGKRDEQWSTGDSTTMEGQHTASWQTGSKLTIKRNG